MQKLCRSCQQHSIWKLTEQTNDATIWTANWLSSPLKQRVQPLCGGNLASQAMRHEQSHAWQEHLAAQICHLDYLKDGKVSPPLCKGRAQAQVDACMFYTLKSANDEVKSDVKGTGSEQGLSTIAECPRNTCVSSHIMRHRREEKPAACICGSPTICLPSSP